MMIEGLLEPLLLLLLNCMFLNDHELKIKTHLN